MKLIFRAAVPYIFAVVVSQTFVDPPPLWWSMFFCMPYLILLCAQVIIEEIRCH